MAKSTSTSMFNGAFKTIVGIAVMTLLSSPLVTASVVAAAGSNMEADGPKRVLQNNVEPVLRRIGGKVLEDTNNDRTGDDPVAGVFLELYTQAGAIVATTTTDSTGSFAFSVSPGFYVLRKVTPAGFVEVIDSDGGNPSQIEYIDVTTANAGGLFFVDELPSNPTLAPTPYPTLPPTPLSTSSETSRPTKWPLFGSIAGNVKEDTNDDGTGDVSLSRVAVSLYKFSNGVLIGTTMTDSEGNFMFTGVLKGKYSIIQSNLPGFVDVRDSRGIRSNSTVVISLKRGRNRKNVNFVVKRLLPAPAPAPSKSGAPNGQPTGGPTIVPTASPTLVVTARPTRHPPLKPTAWQTSKPTSPPTPLPFTPAPTTGPTSIPTLVPTLLPSPSPTLLPSAVKRSPRPTRNPSPKPNMKPTNIPTAIPTAKPKKRPTRPPSRNPKPKPNMKPTNIPTAIPTAKPTSTRPTKRPTRPPSVSPSVAPTTARPTKLPSRGPTVKPSKAPTPGPTSLPTPEPTSLPTPRPTTGVPTAVPVTMVPTAAPTADKAPPTLPLTTFSPSMLIPTTRSPTGSPTTLAPTGVPTTLRPTDSPTTLVPTGFPTTVRPTGSPTTLAPTGIPTTLGLTGSPTTLTPTGSPTTRSPTGSPTTLVPTGVPTTLRPTGNPTTLAPTGVPTTLRPTGNPTTLAPTGVPTTLRPTGNPTTLAPTGVPTTLRPTGNPTTLAPTGVPTTLRPTGNPTTLAPTGGPITLGPTGSPTTLTPTGSPTTFVPTGVPTTLRPTGSPTTVAPTGIPMTLAPTGGPTTLGPTGSPTTLTPTGSPTTRSPTGSPTTRTPTRSPTTLATTGSPTTLTPTGSSMTLAQTGSPTTQSPSPRFTSSAPTSDDCNCRIPKTVPSECEVKEFIKLLDIAVGSEHKVAAQWLRLSFHDAGTFNQVTGEGGANGCLMYHPDMRNEPENGHLDVAINTLEAIKNNWALLNNTCIDVSGADAIQFAGLFAAVRQTDTPGITPAKIAQLLKFEWGRPDESSCKVDWCRNLPDFALGTEDVLPTRCMMAGKEIKNKMMDRNGFTSEEATALIGAHTIGLIRNKFGPVFAAPWVENGADDFTQDGPVFSNSYFGFLENKIIANSTTAFGLNPAPFNKLFPTWVQTAPTNGTKLNYLDTDLVLAFPPRNASDHPDYHVHTAAFSNDRTFFLTTFYKAMTKMGKLGVNNTLNVPSSCTACKVNAESVTESVTDKVVDDVSNAVSAAEGTITDAQEVQQEAIINRTTVTQVFILTDNSTNAVEVSSSPSTQ